MSARLNPVQNSKNKDRTSLKLKINCKERLTTTDITTKNWLELTSKFDHTSDDFKIYTGLLDKRNNIVVKIGLEKLDDEYLIGSKLEELHLPTFISFYCIFKCLDDFSRLNSTTKEICRDSGDTITAIIMPYLSDGQIDKFAWTRLNFKTMKNVIKHVCMSLFTAYNRLHFIHLDLHLGNILLKRTDRVEISYGEFGKVETMGIIPVIMDFEKSRFVEDNQLYVYKEIDNFIGLLSKSCNVTFNYPSINKVLKKYIINNTIITSTVCKDICDKIDEIEINYITSELRSNT